MRIHPRQPSFNPLRRLKTKSRPQIKRIARPSADSLPSIINFHALKNFQPIPTHLYI
jgi:hypothetical protein